MVDGEVGVSIEDFSLAFDGRDLEVSKEGSEGGEEENDAVEVLVAEDESGEGVELGTHDEESVDVRCW